MKLLIVEDQPKTGHYLRQGLAEAGFNTELVADGTSGQQLGADAGTMHLLILDVMLPGRDGWQILQAVRSAGLDIPGAIPHCSRRRRRPGTWPGTGRRRLSGQAFCLFRTAGPGA